jgi:hypothetical protein
MFRVFVTPLLLPAAIVEELELQLPDAVNTVVCAPDDGWSYHPKHVEQFPYISKMCKISSCLIYIGIDSRKFRHLQFIIAMTAYANTADYMNNSFLCLS